jgi:hypothetical protein
MKARISEYSNQFPIRPKQHVVKPRIGSLWYKDSPTSAERLIMANEPFFKLAKERNRLSAFGFVLKRFVIHY